MNEIERYLADLSSRLRVGRRHRARILAEVHDHLGAAAAHREACGEPPEAAVGHAIGDFGPAPMMATQFNAAAGARAMRRAPVVAAAAGIAVCGGFLVAATSQPRTGVSGAASLATQLVFLAAAIAGQVALVAGICTASRTASLWRAPTVPGEHRAFVRRSGLICAVALGVAALGWSSALLLTARRTAQRDLSTLIPGVAVMIVAAAASIGATYHLRVNPDDDDVVVPSRPDVLGLPEQAIGVVRRHPVLSCLAVAPLAGLATMSHAETTVLGALPWGLAEVGAVALAFVVLGPALDLRRDQRRTRAAGVRSPGH